ncbi:hypothetical protein GP486_004626 [Trichoglossum hirsutum]|uniref:Uncharacterized protein n=1 Tax=Trichoglossum hirsutum TaxID=265104 RepID=A0A9P8LAN6_9PEZI|nr:hypothetical protein GP486_004626 [Trichoglossum hirsutum]
MSLDVITPFFMIAALGCRVTRAETEIETHRHRFEKTEALLKLVRDIRGSRKASETSQGWEDWIDGSIGDAEQVIREIKDAVQRKGGRGNGSFPEKISWLLKYKDAAENLGRRLDQCYWSLSVIVIVLVVVAGTRPSEPRQSVAVAGSWLEDNSTPYGYFSNSGLAHMKDFPLILPAGSPCSSRSSTGLSSVTDGPEPPDGYRSLEEEDQEVEMHAWLRERARSDSMEAEEEEEEVEWEF